MKVRSDLYSNKSNVGKSVVKGALAGGVVGAILGGIQANKKIKSLPVETVEVKIKEPVYETKEIGKIPKDQYIPPWSWGFVNTTPTESVYEKVPVKDENGKVLYKEYTQTFQGHGKPIVNYETKEVKEPIFKGYNQIIRADIDQNCIDESDICSEEIEGYWIHFSPKIEYKVIDTYQKPKIKFETGISVLEHVIVGGLIGAAVGGVVGAVLSKLFSKEQK